MSSAPETTGVTATVFDFICLFTHDLKRKQKRWQDGKLKYHTFNRKLMVYDDRGNFVGESHWQEDGDLEDGCELTLERGGAIVQVAECVGERAQDLTELVDKRAKEVEMRRASKAIRSGVPSAASTPSSSRLAPTTHAHHLQQRNLSSLVKSPGPIGRAVVPLKSPFESRIAERTPYMVAPVKPASKRKRSESPPSRMGHARALFGTQLSLSATPLSLSQTKRNALSDKQANVHTNSSAQDDEYEKSQSANEIVEPSQQIEPVRDKSAPSRQVKTAVRPMVEDITMLEASLGSKSKPDKPEVAVTAARAAKPSTKRSSYVAPDSEPAISSSLSRNPSSDRPRKRQRSPSLGGHVAQHILIQEEGTIPAAREPITSDPRITGAQKPLVTVDLTDAAAPKISTAKRHRQKVQRVEPQTGSELPPQLEQESSRGFSKGTSTTEREHKVNARAKHQPVPESVESVEAPSSRLASSTRLVDEPRTELRIRSRQKRGLLLVAEKRAYPLTKPDRKAISAHGDGAGHLRRSKATESAPTSLSPSPKRPGELTVSNCESLPRDLRNLAPDFRPQSQQLGEEEKRFEEWLGANGAIAEDEATGSRDPLSRETETTKPTRPKPRTRAKDHLDKLNDEQPANRETKQSEDQPVKGPRIARLARKSIKSREIIGFIPAQDAEFRMPFANTSTAEICPEEVAPRDTLPSGPAFKEAAVGDPKPISITQGSQKLDSKVSDALQQGGSDSANDPSKSASTRMSPARVLPQQDAGGPKKRPDNDMGPSEESQGCREVPAEQATALIDADLPPSCDLPAQADFTIKSGVGIGKTTDEDQGQRPNSLFPDKPADQSVESVCSNIREEMDLTEPLKGPLPHQQQQSSGPSRGLGGAALQNECLAGRQSESSATSFGEPQGASSALPACASSVTTEHLVSTESIASRVVAQNTGTARQISNPATRGRKAAAKKDAAGMAPRMLVQLDPPRPTIMRRTAVPATKTPAQLSSAGVPGFTTALSGAWSKHALDLLGMTRPGRTAPE
ncbi:hypothetical protein CC79DRAFT_681876 [Sarocladium strictum]